MKFFLKSNIAFTILLIAPTCSNGERLAVSLGHEEEIIKELQQIRDGYLASNAVLENLFVEGRCSRVVLRGKPTLTSIEAMLQMKPKWQPFKLIEKDGKKRWEQGFTQETSAGSIETTIYRLINPEGIYKLDLNLFAVSRLENVSFVWQDYTTMFSQSRRVRDLSTWSTIDVFCENFIERIRGDKDASPDGVPFTDRFGLDIAIEKKGSSISIVVSDYLDSYFVKVIVDSNLGFNITSEIERSGKSNASDYMISDKSVEVQEIAPEVFFPMHATTLVGWPGASNRGDWIRFDHEVSLVKFGDFDVDERLFTLESLPVPRGALVVDNRTNPPNSFTFGEPPISERDLQLAANQTPDISKSKSWLVWINLFLVVVLIGAILINRKFKSRLRIN